MTIQQSAQALAGLLKNSGPAVFFGGAGVSTESGLPDFRSAQGLYADNQKISPEELLSRSFYDRYPEEFYAFYREKMLYPDALPNAAHRTLAKWEQQGLVTAVITQNIDGLHQLAGSREVWELHGSVHRNRCPRCRNQYSLQDILQSEGLPKCACGGLIKPEVVLYEESLPQEAFQGAVRAIERSRLMIVGGTSLRVYPAAGFVDGYQGKLVIINKSPTARDGAADLVIDASIGEVLALTNRML